MNSKHNFKVGDRVVSLVTGTDDVYTVSSVAPNGYIRVEGNGEYTYNNTEFILAKKQDDSWHFRVEHEDLIDPEVIRKTITKERPLVIIKKEQEGHETLYSLGIHKSIIDRSYLIDESIGKELWNLMDRIFDGEWASKEAIAGCYEIVKNVKDAEIVDPENLNIVVTQPEM